MQCAILRKKIKTDYWSNVKELVKNQISHNRRLPSRGRMKKQLKVLSKVHDKSTMEIRSTINKLIKI